MQDFDKINKYFIDHRNVPNALPLVSVKMIGYRLVYCFLQFCAKIEEYAKLPREAVYFNVLVLPEWYSQRGLVKS